MSQQKKVEENILGNKDNWTQNPPEGITDFTTVDMQGTAGSMADAIISYTTIRGPITYETKQADYLKSPDGEVTVEENLIFELSANDS